MYKIDDEDRELVEQYTWYACNGYYATTVKEGSPIGVPGKNLYMHRLIMLPPKDVEIDHINRDKSDNRKSNLRFATRKTNNNNMPIRRDNKSGLVGVSYGKRDNVWISKINGKLFIFENLLDAASHRISFNNTRFEE
jgi:hypothetical protein